MILFCEALYRSCKGLDLSFQRGGSRRLVFLDVVGGGHRACEYHATLVFGRRQVWLKQSPFPQTAPTNDAVNLTSEQHGSNAQMNHLQKEENKKDLVEGVGVVPAKFSLKVKLEIFSQL